MLPQYANRKRAMFKVAHAHPAMAGHFPGNPVVPGVVILHEVILAVGRWLGPGLVVRRLPHAKFVAPLLPGQDAAIDLTRDGCIIAFSVQRGEEILAKGTLEFEGVPSS